MDAKELGSRSGASELRVIRFPRAAPWKLQDHALRTRSGQPGGVAFAVRLMTSPQGRLLLLCIGIVLLILPSPILRIVGLVPLAWVVGVQIFARRAGRRERPRSGGSPGGADRSRRAAIEAGIDGEEAVVRALTRHLPGGPDGYVLFQNLALPGLRGDIDHLVVGPTGLFVLETKNVAGLIQLDREGWRREKVGRRGRLYEAYMDDPLSQVRRNVRALRLYLQRHAPALCASTRLWITELIVFPHPKARLRLADTRVPAYELAAVAPAILGHRPAQRLAPGTVGRLVSLLQAAGEAARGPVPGFPADAGAGVVVVPEVGAPAGPPTGEAPAGTGALGAPYGVVPPAAPPGAVSTVERGNALLETALVVPLLLTLGLGVVGVGRLTQAQMGVRSVAREAARSAVLATSGSAAVSRGLERAYAVAAGYGLRAGALRVAVEPGDFVRGGAVRVDVTYDVTLDDLPFLQWTSLRLSDFHVERIDLYQSRR